jgi:DNA-binding transcriptional ArsR family regulator
MRRDVFQAIADPNRRAIIGLLAGNPLTLNEIAGHFPVSRPAISRHVKILTECGLIAITTQGRERHCEVQMQRLKEVSDWSDQYRRFWSSRLDALEKLLSIPPSNSSPG